MSQSDYKLVITYGLVEFLLQLNYFTHISLFQIACSVTKHFRVAYFTPLVAEM